MVLCAISYSCRIFVNIDIGKKIDILSLEAFMTEQAGYNFWADLTGKQFQTLRGNILGSVAFPFWSTTIGSMLNADKIRRSQWSAEIAREDDLMYKATALLDNANLEKEEFTERSIPVGREDEEILLNDNKLTYYDGNRYSIFDLSNNAYKPITKELINSKAIVLLVDLVACVSQSAFLPKENKDKLLKYLDDYLKALAMSTEDGNFISSTLRGIIGIFYDVHSHDYDELNKKYENYKKSKSSGNDTSTSKIKNKLVKAGEWLTANLFGLRNAERRRFFSMSEALENIQAELCVCQKNIQEKLSDFKEKCTSELDKINVLQEPRRHDFLLRIVKSKHLLQRLYANYSITNDFSKAILQLAAEMYRNNELIKDHSMAPTEMSNQIAKIEKKKTKLLSKEEVEEQVRRYFDFTPNTERRLDKDTQCDISIDRHSKVVEIGDASYGKYYLDFNRLRDDLSNTGCMIYYKTLLNKLNIKADDPVFMANRKNAKVIGYIRDVIQKIESKSLTDDECEYMPNMLFHWISSLMNKPIFEKDVNKKIVTVTYMDNDNKIKTLDDINNLNNFQNVSFDIYNPEDAMIKMGTIIKKGEKIYYREDPGMDKFRPVSATELLTKIDIPALLNQIDGSTNATYVGDCWKLRQLVSMLKMLAKQEELHHKNNVIQAQNWDNRKANDELGVAKNTSSISNLIPINTLTDLLNKNNQDHDDGAQTTMGSNNDDDVSYNGNKANKSKISFERPDMNLQNNTISITQ